MNNVNIFINLTNSSIRPFFTYTKTKVLSAKQNYFFNFSNSFHFGYCTAYTTIKRDKLDDPVDIAQVIKKCSGCGSILQNKKPTSLGYTPQKSFTKRDFAPQAMQNYPDVASESETESFDDNEIIEALEGANTDDVTAEIKIKKPQTRVFLHDPEEINKHPTRKQYKKQLKQMKKELVCQRCHVLKNQHKIIPVNIDLNYFKKELDTIFSTGDESNLILLKFVDIYDFHGSFMPEILRLVKGSVPIIFVANKIDLLPRDVHLNRIKDWLYSNAKQLGFSPRYLYLISSKTGYGMEQLLADLKKNIGNKNIVVVGCTNVGKSTFINKLAEIENLKAKVSAKKRVTTSPFPGTTLGTISFPFGTGRMIDTPGIFNERQLTTILNPEEVKKVSVLKREKPRTIRMREGTSILIGGLAQFDLISGPTASCLLFFSKKLTLHHTSTEKLPELRIKHLGKELTPPIFSDSDFDIKDDILEKVVGFPDSENINEEDEKLKKEREQKKKRKKRKFMSKFDFNFQEYNIKGDTWKQECFDVVFDGLGWLTIRGEGEWSIRAHIIKGGRVSIRKPIITQVSKKNVDWSAIKMSEKK